jgi:hypothetical protein
MRGRPPLGSAPRALRQLRRPGVGTHGRRAIQISATPTTESPTLNADPLSSSMDADSAGKLLPLILDAQHILKEWRRCEIRSARRAIFSFVSLSICVSKVIY